MKSKLIALDIIYIEAKCIKNLLFDILLVNKSLPKSVHCDSKTIIDLVNQFHTNKMMNIHIQVGYKSIRNLLKNVTSLDFRSEKNFVN